MSYLYELKGYYKINCEEKEYSWPSIKDKDRTIRISRKDILTIDSEEDGICVVMRHTGLSIIGILIPKEDLEEFKDTIKLGVDI